MLDLLLITLKECVSRNCNSGIPVYFSARVIWSIAQLYLLVLKCTGIVDCIADQFNTAFHEVKQFLKDFRIKDKPCFSGL